MIVSCINNLKHLSDSFVGKEVWLKYEMENFDQKEGKQFIEKYFEKYNKKFDSNQMNVWMSKSNSNKKFSPLWLKFACNELRIFGEYTTVTKKIEELSLDMDILVTDIIKRIDFEFQNKSIKEVLNFNK
jgi:hypothetical protein